MKIKLSKKTWKKIGHKAQWLKFSTNGFLGPVKIFQDGTRILKLFGSPVQDANLPYDAVIADAMGHVESIITNSTLSEIYMWAKDHGFTISVIENVLRQSSCNCKSPVTQANNFKYCLYCQGTLSKKNEKKLDWNPHEILNLPSRGKMHRCKLCWTEVNLIDNGFKSYDNNQIYPHAGNCKFKGVF